MSDKVTITAHPYEFDCEDVDTDQGLQFNINCWCLDTQSRPLLMRITDFRPFFYIELPKYVSSRRMSWDPSKAADLSKVDSVVKSINAILRGQDQDSSFEIKKHKLEIKKKYYYYKGKTTYPMLKVEFNSLKAMDKCANIVNQKSINTNYGNLFLYAHETRYRIPPLRKFLTAISLKNSQWFMAYAYPVEEKISVLEQEYSVKHKQIVPIPDEKSSGLSTNPTVMAIDIECYSDNYRAMPDKHEDAHVMYMLSIVSQKYKQPETRQRYGIIYGDCNDIPPERLEKCTIHRVDSEYGIILKFADLLREVDPDIIIGYNLLKFDYPYMEHRMERQFNSWPEMGRLVGVPANYTSFTWNSSAYGPQSINSLNMVGRITIDLYPTIKRDYKLDDYKLDTVASKFVGKTKHDVKPAEIFSIYENLMKRIQDMESCDESNLAERKALLEEAKKEMDRIMEYCIQDSELTLDIMDKINVWSGLVEMSNIAGVSIVELITRGQQIRGLSKIYDFASRKGFIIDERDAPENLSYKGAIIVKPEPGLFENVICLDFSSLYPSIMMAYLICHTTLASPEIAEILDDAKYRGKIHPIYKLEDFECIEFTQDEAVDDTIAKEDRDDEFAEFDTGKKKEVTMIEKNYRYYWYKDPEQGVMPSILKTLIQDRRDVNRKLGEQKGIVSLHKRLESIIRLLRLYKDGKEPGDVAQLSNEYKELINSNGDPKKIIQVKLELDYSLLLKGKIKDIPSNELAANVATVENEIITAYLNKDHDTIIECMNQLEEGSEDRKKIIDQLSTMNIVLDKRQLAIKVCANSFYGLLGVQEGGKIPLLEGAMTVTAVGRKLITQVSEYIEDTHDGKLIYGDTDSVMVSIPAITERSQCYNWGIRLAQEISGVKKGVMKWDGTVAEEAVPGLFPPPLAMEFEKAMRLLCICKKKYAALLIAKDGSFKTEDILDADGNVIGKKNAMLLKGIVLARRDNNKLLKTMYREVLDIIINEGSILDGLKVIERGIQSLVNGSINYEDLASTRQLGGNYKSKTYFMKVFSDCLAKAGKIVFPGDRLKFVVCKVEQEVKCSVCNNCDGPEEGVECDYCDEVGSVCPEKGICTKCHEEKLADEGGRRKRYKPAKIPLGARMRLIEQYEESRMPDSPIEPLQLDVDYYMNNVLAKPISQLFGVGFARELSRLGHVGLMKTPRSRKPIRMDDPVSMMSILIGEGRDISQVWLDASKTLSEK